MTNDIVNEATEAVTKGLPCAYLVPHLLEVAKTQKLEIEILIRKKEALRDEIAEQQSEIERLQKLNGSFACLGKLYSEIKTEAYREFAERLKDFRQWDVDAPDYVYVDTIDDLLKELTEGGNEEPPKNDFKE